MTEYGLQPSYVKLDYSTPFGNHSHTIPTLQWLPTSIMGNMGSYVAWDTVPIDAEAMIDSLVALLKPEIGSDSSYDLASIYNFDVGSGKFRPEAFKALAVAGTGSTASPRKAVSQTINMRTVGGSTFKIVHLDHSLGASEFDKIPPLGFGGAALAIVTEVTLTSNAWSGRDNTRPNGIISATFDLNDALRRQYRMV